MQTASAIMTVLSGSIIIRAGSHFEPREQAMVVMGLGCCVVLLGIWMIVSIRRKAKTLTAR